MLYSPGYGLPGGHLNRPDPRARDRSSRSQAARRAPATIGIVGPLGKWNAGNRVTAARWARIFRRLGWRVLREESWGGHTCDILVALHARRSHASIQRFHRECPGQPLVVTATGTDLYGDEPLSPEARASFELASRIVVLQPRAIEDLPEEVRSRARVIHQSVPTVRTRVRRSKTVFKVCSIAHLRPVKDPLLPAKAARLLPASSRIRIVHLGGLIDEAMRDDLEREIHQNPRFRWMGQLPRAETLRRLASGRVFVSSSRHEGGSNAMSEAIALGIPVLSTRIPGSIGLLGEDHPGYYPVGDARALGQLMQRAETDPEFLQDLEERSRSLATVTDPVLETERWRMLLEELQPAGPLEGP